MQEVSHIFATVLWFVDDTYSLIGMEGPCTSQLSVRGLVKKGNCQPTPLVQSPKKL